MTHSPDVPLNPYQPTLEIPEEELADPDRVLPPRLSNPSFFGATLLSVVTAAAAFGLSLSLVAVGGIVFGGRLGIEVVLVPMVGAFIGSVLGLFTGLPTTALLTAIAASTRGKRPWDRHSVRRFAGLSGGLSGYLSVAVPGSFQQEALVAGLVPALFGGVVSMLMTSHLLRRHWEEPARPTVGAANVDTLAQ